MAFGKKKSGSVYFGESTRKNGSKQTYVGKTRRPVSVRWKEHLNSVKSENGKTWVSKGTNFKPMGAIFSRNPDKAERTIKKLKPYQKKYLARGGAMRYKKRNLFGNSRPRESKLITFFFKQKMPFSKKNKYPKN